MTYMITILDNMGREKNLCPRCFRLGAYASQIVYGWRSVVGECDGKEHLSGAALRVLTFGEINK